MDAFGRRLRELITRDVEASLRKEEQSAATPSEVEALVDRRLEAIAECIYRVTTPTEPAEPTPTDSGSGKRNILGALNGLSR